VIYTSMEGTPDNFLFVNYPIKKEHLVDPKITVCPTPPGKIFQDQVRA